LGGNDAVGLTVAIGMKLASYVMLLSMERWYLLAVADEQLSVVDNRLSPDVFADSSRQLNETFSFVHWDDLTLMKIDVDEGNVSTILPQRRHKCQLCLGATDAMRKFLSVD
jgi:hypothetical protein